MSFLRKRVKSKMHNENLCMNFLSYTVRETTSFRDLNQKVTCFESLLKFIKFSCQQRRILRVHWLPELSPG